MSRTISRPRAASPACTASRLAPSCPAKRLYTALRRDKGLSHEEATNHLREALKRYFRAA